jgi:hypothetical protein
MHFDTYSGTDVIQFVLSLSFVSCDVLIIRFYRDMFTFTFCSFENVYYT